MRRAARGSRLVVKIKVTILGHDESERVDDLVEFEVGSDGFWLQAVLDDVEEQFALEDCSVYRRRDPVDIGIHSSTIVSGCLSCRLVILADSARREGGEGSAILCWDCVL